MCLRILRVNLVYVVLERMHQLKWILDFRGFPRRGQIGPAVLWTRLKSCGRLCGVISNPRCDVEEDGIPA